MVHGTDMPDVAAFPSLVEVPVYVRFREHHCISPARPVPTGGTQRGFDDGLMNGYLPNSFEYHHVGNSLKISVSGAHSQIFRYEDYVEGKPNSHDPSKCTGCLLRATQEHLRIRERAARHEAVAAEQPVGAHAVDADEDAVDTDEDAEIEPAPRDRRGSVSSIESDVSYFFGDESDPDNIVRTRHMMLERDPDTEALRDEMMTDGVPEFRNAGLLERECDGVEDVIITGEVRRACLVLRGVCALLMLRVVAPCTDATSPRRSVASFPLLRPRPQVGRPHRPRSRTHIVPCRR